MGQALTAADGLGFPNIWRAAAVTALTGFQFAIACNQPGMPPVGTNELEMKANGNKKMNPIDCADSGPLLFSPKHAAAQDSE